MSIISTGIGRHPMIKSTNTSVSFRTTTTDVLFSLLAPMKRSCDCQHRMNMFLLFINRDVHNYACEDWRGILPCTLPFNTSSNTGVHSSGQVQTELTTRVADMTYFTSKQHPKTQVLRPYGCSSSFSAALWAAPMLDRPEGPLGIVVQLEAPQKESIKIQVWQHY